MRAFRFNLQRILDIRKLEEEQIAMILAEIRLRLSKFQQEKSSIEKHRESTLSEWSEAQKGTIQIPDLIQYQHHIVEINNEIVELEESLRKIKEEIEGVQKKLVEASKKTRILERLKEKKWSKYRGELEKEEQANLDEIGQQMFFRKGQM